MPKSVVISTILFFLFIRGISQETGFRYSDSITYQLYMQKSWDDLIKTGKEAIGDGHDYYYMRMRLGIAYLEKKNYGNAAIQFKKALLFNQNDQVALEYLFYAHLYSGRYTQAWAVLSGLQTSNRERVIKESNIKKNTITIETFYNDALTDNITKQPELYLADPEPGTQSITTRFINNSIYLFHITGKRTSYFHSFTNLIKDNYFHYFDGSFRADLISQRVIQNQYYGRLGFFGPSGWTISPSIHLLTAGYPLIYFSSTGSASTYRDRSGGFAGGLGITRTGDFLTLSGEVVYSSLNKTKQLQGSLSITAYPAGNRNLYFGGSFTMVSDHWSPETSSRFIPGFIAGFSVNEKIWFEFSGSKGEMKNYSENVGMIIFNSTDYLTEKYSGKIIIPFYRAGFTLFAGAGRSASSSEFLPLPGETGIDMNKINYKSYSITGGISWNF